MLANKTGLFIQKSGASNVCPIAHNYAFECHECFYVMERRECTFQDQGLEKRRKKKNKSGKKKNIENDKLKMLVAPGAAWVPRGRLRRGGPLQKATHKGIHEALGLVCGEGRRGKKRPTAFISFYSCIVLKSGPFDQHHKVP